MDVTQSAIAAMGIVPLNINTSPAGRVPHFHTNWQKLTKDRWVLDTVRGYEIENPTTISNPIGPKPTGIGIARDHRIDLKRGGDRGANPTGGWVFFHPLSGAEK